VRLFSFSHIFFKALLAMPAARAVPAAAEEKPAVPWWKDGQVVTNVLAIIVIVGFVSFGGTSKQPRITSIAMRSSSAAFNNMLVADDVECIAHGFKGAGAVLWVAQGKLYEEDPDISSEGFLLFSDAKTNTIYRYKERPKPGSIVDEDGKAPRKSMLDSLAEHRSDWGITEYISPSGSSDAAHATTLLEPGANGIQVDPASESLIVCEHGERVVSSHDWERGSPPSASKASRIVVASHFKGTVLALYAYYTHTILQRETPQRTARSDLRA
jgi:hypothetical protein